MPWQNISRQLPYVLSTSKRQTLLSNVSFNFREVSHGHFCSFLWYLLWGQRSSGSARGVNPFCMKSQDILWYKGKEAIFQLDFFPFWGSKPEFTFVYITKIYQGESDTKHRKWWHICPWPPDKYDFEAICGSQNPITSSKNEAPNIIGNHFSEISDPRLACITPKIGSHWPQKSDSNWPQ